EYLGLNPPDVVVGALQDVHWSDMTFGYFPTYALGNVVSVQLWERAEAELGELDEQFERGDFGPLREWLRENVHRHGRSFTPQELLQRVTGSAMDPAPPSRDPGAAASAASPPRPDRAGRVRPRRGRRPAPRAARPGAPPDRGRPRDALARVPLGREAAQLGRPAHAAGDAAEAIAPAGRPRDRDRPRRRRDGSGRPVGRPGLLAALDGYSWQVQTCSPSARRS